MKKTYYFVCGGRALLWCSFSIPEHPKIVLFFKSELYMNAFKFDKTKKQSRYHQLNNHMNKNVAPSVAFKSEPKLESMVVDSLVII